MDFIQGILEYRFLSNALWVSLLSGVLCGIVGTYVVCRRLVFMSGGITHSSFGGIGIAYYMGLSPIMGATVFALLSAVGIEWAAAKGRIREDSAIGIVWSLGMALGVVFIYLTPGYAPNLMSFLFGNILTVTNGDLIVLGGLAGVVILLFCLFFRPILYVAFDREFARSQGMPVGLISYTIAIIVALTIVFSIRVVGIILLISLLTLPAVIANSFTKSYLWITIWAVAIAVVGNVLGLWVSYIMNVPTGATTIFILTIMLIGVKLLSLTGKRHK